MEVGFDGVIASAGAYVAVGSQVLLDQLLPEELVCQYVGADIQDTVAFGDSMNDAAMLERAGRGVAMGNACDELKSLADAVCEDVSHDGVYHEFYRMGLCG